MALTDENGMVMPVSPYMTGAGNGFSDGNGWWIILLFIILFAAGGWNNGRGGSGAVDNYVLASDFSQVERKIDDVNNGLCNGFYQEAQLVNGLQQSMATQGYETRNAVNQNSNAIQTQLAQCCCDIREGISGVNYNMAINNNSLENTMCNNTRDIIENQTNGTRAILDAITSNKLEAKNDKIADLERKLTMASLTSSQNAQTSQLLADNARQTVAIEQALNPTPIPAYMVANPNCCNSCNTCGSF